MMKAGNFFRQVFLVGCIGVLTGCSESTEDFPNLARVGDRIPVPDTNSSEVTQSLRKDRAVLLKESSFLKENS